MKRLSGSRCASVCKCFISSETLFMGTP
jgi:hypothetical protein